MTATFNDGSSCRLRVVHGDPFEPREGERFLFEFPEGTLKEGTVHLGDPPEACWDHEPCHGVVDHRTKIVALTV